MRKFLLSMHQNMIKNFTFLDYGFLKLYGAIFGLLIGAYFADIVKSYVLFFLLIFLCLMIRFLWLIFVKK